MSFIERLDLARLYGGAAMAGNVFVGAFAPAFGAHATDAARVTGAAIGIGLTWILRLKHML